MDSNPNDDYSLLAAIGQKLQQAYTADSDWQIPDEVMQQLAMLDQIARQSKRWYSLFDFQKFNFLFFSSNLPALVGDDDAPHALPAKWDPKYLSVAHDRKSIPDFISVRKEILGGMKTPPLAPPVSSVCGGTIINLKNQRMRMHYRSTPLVWDAAGNVVLSFDYLEDISALMTPTSGYWMRFALDGRAAHWHSYKQKTVWKDILSDREKNLIHLLRNGHTIAEIADTACVNRQTVKNQLNTVRNRLFVRDNTALVQLCTMTGLLPHPH